MEQEKSLTYRSLAGSKAVFPVLVLSLVCMSYVGAQDTSYGRNYKEEKVQPYTAPDPLLKPDGSRVKDAEDWESWRRADVLQDFRDLMYGHTPDLPVRLRTEMVASRNDAVDGLATRIIVDLELFEDSDAPRIQLMLYLPNGVAGPVPVYLGLNFYGNASVEKDSLIPLPQGWMRFHNSRAVIDNRATDDLRGLSENRWPLELILRRGYGVATFYYGDVEPDHIEGWRDGIRGYALRRAGRMERKPDDWGALGAWSWGLSGLWIILRRYLRLTPNAWWFLVIPAWAKRPCGRALRISGLPLLFPITAAKAGLHWHAATSGRISHSQLPMHPGGIVKDFESILTENRNCLLTSTCYWD